mmetsp:Transcript_7659/g.16435  ORF Transcript_7659/g.16435 Transcript_7659/m.16435 type:complete len:284 (+) Transcript_7659:26-877(+)
MARCAGVRRWRLLAQFAAAVLTAAAVGRPSAPAACPLAPRGLRPPRSSASVCRAGPKSYGPDDYYSRRAREEGVPARSYFKLEEIDKRLRLLKPGDKVLDMGCWPGSWTLYAARRVGPKGRVLGVDLQTVTFPLPENAKTRVEDAYHFTGKGMPEMDVVLSDMAPKTTGQGSMDEDNSFALVELVMGIADRKLAEGGALLAKIFEGARIKELERQLQKRYETVRRFRPKATRSQSNEIYVCGLGKRNIPPATLPARREPAASRTDPRRPPPRRVPVPQSFNGW